MQTNLLLLLLAFFDLLHRSQNQKAFWEQEIQPRSDEARAGQQNVFFRDAAHFGIAPFPGFLWSVVRAFIQASSKTSKLPAMARRTSDGNLQLA
jgi:hypothetical protein